MIYIDAGTSFSKIMTTNGDEISSLKPFCTEEDKKFYIIRSSEISTLGVKFDDLII